MEKKTEKTTKHEPKLTILTYPHPIYDKNVTVTFEDGTIVRSKKYEKYRRIEK